MSPGFIKRLNRQLDNTSILSLSSPENYLKLNSVSRREQSWMLDLHLNEITPDEKKITAIILEVNLVQVVDLDDPDIDYGGLVDLYRAGYLKQDPLHTLLTAIRGWK